MSLTVKHNADGSFYEMGDTQSFVLVDMPIYSVNATIPADYWNATAAWTELPQTRWTCPKDGKYLIIARFNFGGTGSEIVEAGSFYKNGTITYNPTQGIRPGLEHSNYCQIYNLVAGDVMSIGVSKKAQGPKGTTNSAELQIVQLKKTVPDIIANKGALVSGGSFQFDIDGNCYTENYSTDEVKVGKWINEKKVYQRSIDAIIGDINGLVNGATKIFNLLDVFPGMSTMIHHALYVSINGFYDYHLIGTLGSWGQGEIQTDAITTTLDPVHAKKLTIKNNSGSAMAASGRDVWLRGTVWYTK
jgi:hypothetical protein